MSLIPTVLMLALTLAQNAIPNVDLTVGFRERLEGREFNKAVYVLQVSCRDGECSYSYVSINDCRPIRPGVQGFVPKVEIASTRNGDVKATTDGRVLTLEQTGTDSFGNWVNTFRIEYEPATAGQVSTRVLNFTGDFVKTSELIRQPTRIEYVALQQPLQEVRLDCAVVAPGVSPK